MESWYPPETPWITEQISKYQEWYFSQLKKYPQIYGDEAQNIAQGLGRAEPALDGLSSFVMISLVTESGRLEDEIPVLLFRVSRPGKDGLLPSERHYLHRGLSHAHPNFEIPHTRRVALPTLIAGPVKDHFPITVPAPTESILWPVGGKLELKSYCMDPVYAPYVLPYAFYIADVHRLFTYGGEEPPEGITGAAGGVISEFHRPLMGMLSPILWADNYGGVLDREYSLLGLRQYTRIQSRETAHKKITFRYSRDSILRERLRARIERLGGLPADGPDWLVYDRKMARSRRQGCGGELERRGDGHG
ncbi:MAG: hypothetical protein HYZ71_13975 [Deltaproteobacteria bacterium]|nr:hypothetical protein [Deltaproteobacteria bacterium]